MPLTAEALSKEPYSQAHLFEKASAAEKESLVQQLNEIDGKLPGGGLEGYLARARQLLKDAQSGKNPFAGLTPVVPEGETLIGDDGPGTERYAQFECLGMAALDKTCFVLVAGGLGERLGYPGIKIGITAEVTTGQCFFEIYARFILAFQDYARRNIDNSAVLPLAIMTSGDTHEKTVELLEANNYFGLQHNQVTLLKQELVPALADVDARIASNGGKVEVKPHGHGDVHSLLHESGTARKWMDEGKEWLFIFQDTNPLAFRSFCAVLGVSVANSFVMNSVAVPRIPKEAIGGICTLQDSSGKPMMTVNVEYNQLEPLLKETPTGGDVADESGFSPYPGNINLLVFNLAGMARGLHATSGIVPEFVNPKWADDKKTAFKSPTRLECMMQDFPRLCAEGDRVGFTALDRQMCFTCVKNNLADAAKKSPADCALSAEADIYACNSLLLHMAGQDIKIDPPTDVTYLGITARLGARIVLQPSFGISLEEVKTRVRGKIRITANSVLVIDGDVIIDGLELDGALEVMGSGTLKDQHIENASAGLERIPDAEMSAVEPSLQIRGYRRALGDTEVRTVERSVAEHASFSIASLFTCCTSRPRPPEPLPNKAKAATILDDSKSADEVADDVPEKDP